MRPTCPSRPLRTPLRSPGSRPVAARPQRPVARPARRLAPRPGLPGAVLGAVALDGLASLASGLGALAMLAMGASAASLPNAGPLAGLGLGLAVLLLLLAAGYAALARGLLRGRTWARWTHVGLAGLAAVSGGLAFAATGSSPKLVVAAAWAATAVGLLGAGAERHFAPRPAVPSRAAGTRRSGIRRA